MAVKLKADRIINRWLRTVSSTHFRVRVPKICTVVFPRRGLAPEQVKHLAEVIKTVMGILTYESPGIERELFSVIDYIVVAHAYLKTHPAAGSVDDVDALRGRNKVLLNREIGLAGLRNPGLFDVLPGELMYRPWILKAISDIARTGDIAFLQLLTFKTSKSKLTR